MMLKLFKILADDVVGLFCGRGNHSRIYHVGEVNPYEPTYALHQESLSETAREGNHIMTRLLLDFQEYRSIRLSRIKATSSLGLP